MLWFIIALMLLVAVLAVAWPQFREEKEFSLRSALAITCVLAFSIGLYSQIGQPGVQSAVGPVSNIEDMVDSLAQRLKTDAEDVDGWVMLGRSYVELNRYPEAIAAYERAAELESYRNGLTLVNLGETIMRNDGGEISTRASEVFESALAVAPRDPRALLYGGISAINRGEPLLAADRWEMLLATSPPPEIEGMLRQKVAEWRGVETPVPLRAANPEAGTGLIINVQLGAAASPAVDPNATVFVFARDPAQPSPPIAAVRRRASELPFAVSLSDSDSMIPGRVISNYSELEIVVRASSSGQPIAQKGDWYGDSKIDTEASRTLDIVIDRQVP